MFFYSFEFLIDVFFSQFFYMLFFGINQFFYSPFKYFYNPKSYYCKNQIRCDIRTSSFIRANLKAYIVSTSYVGFQIADMSFFAFANTIWHFV